MESKENSAHSAPPLNRPRGKRKALAELPTSTGPNTNHGSAPRSSNPRTRSAARTEAEADEARKRQEAEDAARGPTWAGRWTRGRLEPKRPRRRSRRTSGTSTGTSGPWSKYEEIESSKMKVNRYTDITDDTYTKQQVVKMEADLLKSLRFEIGGPTVTTFLWKFIASCRGGNSINRGKLESMCSYLAELSLLDYDCISYLPSVLAAACLFVARFTIHPKTRPWNLTLEQNTGYKVFDLQKSIYVIHELQLTISLGACRQWLHHEKSLHLSLKIAISEVWTLENGFCSNAAGDAENSLMELSVSTNP
ncbi:unnamed protein product [Miscanthus lutarioriparius]|uniref:Uncharacterized protein n=1 Tax=Miscanthus lutarioriparius TaxID=422564 RepID=A0A811M7S2_9POAL|nr:unnamed protein product [Miscanthus lutarioriparius]